MLLRRIYVIFLALFILTTGYHVMKEKSVWKWTMKRFTHPVLPPIAPMLLIPIDLFPTKKLEPLSMKPTTPTTPTTSSVVQVGYHRPLHPAVSRRRHHR